MRSSKHGGFTIIEMLIATTVFSVVLLLCATVILTVGKLFYKGLAINRTQDATRRVVDDISQAIQFGAGTADPANFRRVSPSAPGSDQALCLGEVKYTYNTSTALGPSPHVLWKSRIGLTDACVPEALTGPLTNGVELVGDNMRIPHIRADDLDGDGVWTVEVRVAYGDTTDLFTDNTFSQCVPDNQGGQFCAVSSINTFVVKRL
jgi:prepilin-type N-terminal cleavage/methylation domain-containing protein